MSDEDKDIDDAIEKELKGVPDEFLDDIDADDADDAGDDGEQDDDADQHGDQVLVGQVHDAEVGAAPLHGVVPIEPLGATEDEEETVAEEDRQADADHQLGDQRNAPGPQRAEQRGIQKPAEGTADDHRQSGGKDQIDSTSERDRPSGHEAEESGQAVEVEEVGGEVPHRDHFRMGEVHQAGGAEDQAQPDGRHAQEKAKLGPVDGELGNTADGDTRTRTQ